MKIPQCYFKIMLRLGQRKTAWLLISEAKTGKGTDIQSVASLYMLFMHRKMSFSRECLSKRD